MSLAIVSIATPPSNVSIHGRFLSFILNSYIVDQYNETYRSFGYGHGLRKKSKRGNKMVTVYDVPAEKLILKVAEKLKQNSAIVPLSGLSS